MRKIFLSLLILVAACSSAQVTTDPAIIPVGYTGQVTITFDPTKGNGGMIGATECYLYSCVEFDHTGSWTHELAPWPSKTAKTKMTKSGSNWVMTISNLNTFYNVPSDSTITSILVLFTDGVDGKSGKAGRGPNNQDIVIVLGEEMAGDIWENFTPQAAVSQTRPSGISNGIYYDANDPTVVTLCTYAGSKTQAANHVYVIGDMTDWKLSHDYQMKKDGKYFWLKLTGLEPGKEYRFQYAIERADGVKKQISDLYSEKVISRADSWARKVDPSLIAYPLRGADGGYVTVIQTQKPAFNWSSATLNFQRPNKDNLVIYELWPYDHTAERTLNGLINRLDYIENLGVNAVELMPMCEYETQDGWGYNPTHYFSMHKACGTPDQLKTFIDECHKRGIAVIIDMVFNHTTGLNPMAKLYPKTGATDEPEFQMNPWFNWNVPHKDGLLEDWNHAFAPAREMFTRALQYWLREFKVDGFRMDMSYGLCGETDDDLDNLRYYYANGIKAVSPDAYFILEHWDTGASDLVSEGMMVWTDNGHKAYQQIAMGYTDGSYTGLSNRDGYVSYCESHDEERCFAKAKMWGAGSVASNENERVSRVPMVLGLLCMHNGPKMFYHFAELGFDYSKYQDMNGLWGNDDEDEYKAGTQYGITPDLQKAVKMWPKHRPEEWMRGGSRMEAYKKVGQILQLRTRILPHVFEGNPTAVSLSGTSDTRTIQWGDSVFVAANMSATTARAVTLPSGTWYDYLNGGAAVTGSANLPKGDIRIYTKRLIAAPDVPTSYDFPEAIEWISTETKSDAAYKIIRNGQVLIVRGDRVYTITGARVQ